MGVTRKEASLLIQRRRVRCDDVAVRTAASHIDPATQVVRVDGEIVAWHPRRVLMLHKPAGVVTANRDDHEPTVFDLVPPEFKRDLVAIGRLDKDATGLLLLTNDGGLVHALTHPKRGVEKIYEVTYEGALVDPEARFAAGITLADGTRCRPAGFEAIGPGRCRVVVHEGRYHQVKRMIAACGAHVTALHRAAVGSLRLDPALPPGAVRPLTDAELEALEDRAG